MTAGDELRKIRIALGKTQQEVADEVFVTRQTISKWELGKSEPDFISAELLRKALQLPTPKKEAVWMKQPKNWLGLVVFGIVFLPFRMGWVQIKKYQQYSVVRFVIVPAVIVLYALYMYSLKVEAFYVVLAVTIIAYMGTSYYFQQREE
ncbi:helix-turn-helix transcriptional regulator [Metalysinibacillus jejuensis]|uniref:helix-turn-helix transcriptional regulator n=1 Tax=Metalysinibacillus jejuensis TaxID=914327 RepID=UPI000D36A440|nr:helix-turn-helix transcriptional regulator [Metalysinibacillus jejuensis]